jgi:hypothetical protein
VGVEDGIKYVALGVGDGPTVSVGVGVEVSKMALGCGKVGEAYSGVIVTSALVMTGVGVVRALMLLPTHTMTNPSR